MPDRQTLRALADEALARLNALQARYAASQDQGFYPGFDWRDVDAARRDYEDAERRAADAAEACA